MANNFTPVGNEVQVNLAPNQNDDQFDPDVALLADGRFFITFGEDDTGDSNVIGQFVNPDGTLSGANITIDILAGDQRSPSVAQRDGGAAVVVWNDGVSDDIQYSIVSSAGVAGPEQTILADADPVRFADVATLADGRSLVVATQEFGPSPLDENIVFRFIDALGAPSGVQEFLDDGAGDQFDAKVAAFGDNALVVYSEVTGPSFSIQARFFNGTSFAAKVVIADAADFLLSCDVAALTDGRFIVVWKDDNSDEIRGRLVSSTGVPVGTTFVISDAGGDNSTPRVAALPDGGFIASWTNDGGLISPELDADDRAILARRFDSSGAPAGDLFLVNTGDPDTAQSLSAVAANPATGQAFIAWSDGHAFAGAGEDADPFGVRGRAFIATTDVVEGTGGDDIIQTYGLAEPINGLGGDDLINGLAGDDVIHGGAGFDQLKGGLGDDRLFGEGGEDLLKGEAGNDLLVGGLGRDVQIGGTGRDTFDFNRAVESRVGANHDLVKGFSHAQHDKINLQTIDADTTTGGNQAFDFIGGAGFTGTAGELRLLAGLLSGDTNGNGIADFEIKVTGIGAGANSDFVL